MTDLPVPPSSNLPTRPRDELPRDPNELARLVAYVAERAFVCRDDVEREMLADYSCADLNLTREQYRKLVNLPAFHKRLDELKTAELVAPERARGR
ncbi:MAG: hypothetical protein AB1486_29025 [Planctomycetota bacterium]